MKIEDLTLYGAVAEAAKNPHTPALYYKGVNVSYEHFLREVDVMAGWFSARGIGAGDPVTICVPNIPSGVVCFYALNKIGAIAHMVHPMAPENQLRGYMQKAKSKMLVLPNIFAYKYDSLIAEYPTLLCSPSDYLGAIKRTLFGLSVSKKIKPFKNSPNVTFYADAVKSSPPSVSDFTDSRATVVYFHSGGTSGEPKTIELSSHAVNSLVSHTLEILNIAPEDFRGGCMLAVLPMFHGFGLAMGVHAFLTLGGTATLMPKFNADEAVKYIAKNKINVMIGVPTLYEALLKNKGFTGKKLRNVWQAFVGGDYVPARLLADFNARMSENGSSGKLFEGYGLTETVTVDAVNTTVNERAGSIGKPLNGITFLAFDGDKPLPTGSEGELCISTEQIMNGYLGDPEATAAAIFEYDGKRFLRTGDFGHIDEDGFVFFKSRIKRVIKVSGVPVFPSEIEKLVMDNMDEVAEACAVPMPHEKRGNAVVLFLTVKDGADKDKLASALPDFIADNLGVYARPDRVEIIKELPRTGFGKIDAEALKRSLK